MKMLFQAASVAAFCSLALAGITHAQSAEYIDSRLEQIKENIELFENKMEAAGCETAEDADVMAMCERLSGRISAHKAREAMYEEGVPADYSSKKAKRLNRDLAKLEKKVEMLMAKRDALDSADADYEEMMKRFNNKITYRKAKIDRIKENLSSMMAEPPTSE